MILSTYLSESVFVCICPPPNPHRLWTAIIYWLFFKSTMYPFRYISLERTVRSLQTEAQCSRFYTSLEMCVFPLDLSFQLSYDCDGTTLLCMELSQEVSDRVEAKHTSGFTHQCTHLHSHVAVCMWHISTIVSVILSVSHFGWAWKWARRALFYFIMILQVLLGENLVALWQYWCMCFRNNSMSTTHISSIYIFIKIAQYLQNISEMMPHLFL